MTLRIEKQECQVQEGGVLIRTKCPREQITDAMVATAVRWMELPEQNNRVVLQVTDHYGKELHHEVEYRLISTKEELRTEDVDNGRQTMTRTHVTVEVERKGEWWSSKLAPVVETAKKKAA